MAAYDEDDPIRYTWNPGDVIVERRSIGPSMAMATPMPAPGGPSMPWHLVPDHAECGQGKVAVVKDADNSVVACHPNEAAAKKHMAALYANEPGAGRGYTETEAHSMAAVERRYTMVTVEVRSAGTQPKIGGYAAVFDKPSSNLGGFIEVVRGAFFNDWRAKGWPDVVARFDHENAFLLGTTAARTLELHLDTTGLFYEVIPPQARADVVELVERGDVRKSSFAFRVPPGGDEWGLSDQGYPQRSLIAGAQLVDVAPVISPAYDDTSAGLRSLAAWAEADEDEVRSLAADNDLRRFFVKTQRGMPAAKPAKPKTFGPAAVAAILAKREDPWG